MQAVQYSTVLKLKCIMEREAGKSFPQIGRENNVRYTTVMKRRRKTPPCGNRIPPGECAVHLRYRYAV